MAKDELTRIDGIGNGRAEFLRRHFGITDLAGLARLNPDAVADAFVSARIGNPPSRETAAAWISAAQKRSAVGASGWETVGLFMLVVEERNGDRQTIVRHVDTNSDRTWPGLALAPAMDWIRDRLQSDQRGDAGQTHPPNRSEAWRRLELDDLVDHVAIKLGDRFLEPAGDGNIHTPVPSGVPFEVSVAPVEGLAPSELTLIIDVFGERASSTVHRPLGLEGMGPVDGLEPGLYWIRLVRDGRRRWDGPLFAVG